MFPTFIQLLQQTIAIHKKYWKQFMGFQLKVFGICFGSVMGLTIIAIIGGMLQLPPAMRTPLAAVSALAAIALLVTLFVYGSTAFSLLVSDAIDQKERFDSLRETMTRTTPTLVRVVPTGIITMLLTYGISAIALLGENKIIDFIFISFLPVIISGWIGFATYIALFETKSNFVAIKQSIALVRGHWWPVFWRINLLSFGYFYGLMAIQMIIFILISIFFHEPTFSPEFAEGVANVIVFILGFASFPIVFIFDILIYRLLKKQKENPTV